MLDIPPACYRRSGRSAGHSPRVLSTEWTLCWTFPPRVIDGVDLVLDIPPACYRRSGRSAGHLPACYRRSGRSAGHFPRVLSTEGAWCWRCFRFPRPRGRNVVSDIIRIVFIIILTQAPLFLPLRAQSFSYRVGDRG